MYHIHEILNDDDCPITYMYSQCVPSKVYLISSSQRKLSSLTLRFCRRSSLDDDDDDDDLSCSRIA